MVMQDHIQLHYHKAVLAVHVPILQSVQTARRGPVGGSYHLSPKKIDMYLAGEPKLSVISSPRRGEGI